MEDLFFSYNVSKNINFVKFKSSQNYIKKEKINFESFYNGFVC